MAAIFVDLCIPEEIIFHWPLRLITHILLAKMSYVAGDVGMFLSIASYQYELL